MKKDKIKMEARKEVVPHKPGYRGWIFLSRDWVDAIVLTGKEDTTANHIRDCAHITVEQSCNQKLTVCAGIRDSLKI